jgi:plastocyanin
MRTSFDRCLACLLLIGVVGCGTSTMPEPKPDPAQALALRAGGENGSTPGTTTEVATGTGWGTLKGVFRFKGTAPSVGFLSTGGKDGATCGSQVPDESLVIDPATGGIANVLVFARRVSRVDPDLMPDGDAVFDQKKCIFLSHLLGVQVGQTVLLKNSDPIGHNTNLSPPGNSPANVLLPADGTATYTFTRELSSPVEVTCNIHPWMKAYLMARKDPYFAVSGPDGSFEIASLPAGEKIEFQVWHERASGGLQAKPTWSRGRFTEVVPEDGLDLQVIEVDASAFQ